jgi:fido (protein-threonine AMPylation protein)
MSVVLAHPYEDGNGRSARTMAQLVRYGIDISNQNSIDEMMQVSANRPPHGFRINGYLPRRDAGDDKTPQELIGRMARTDIPLDETVDYLAQRQAEFSEPYTD